MYNALVLYFHFVVSYDCVEIVVFSTALYFCLQSSQLCLYLFAFCYMCLSCLDHLRFAECNK